VRKLLIANRGEIAVRVIRTARELGLRTVAIYAEGEADSLWARMADEAWALPGRTASATYLNIEAVIEVLRRSGADALHPGYGFLSENASFARAVAEVGVVFVGPPPHAIELMGDKIAARRAAEATGVQSPPGTSAALDSPEEIVAFGNSIGWPVVIKAAHGGGGRGMRVVNSPTEAADALASAQREATSAFGRGECYLEKYFPRPRHVEVQVFADSHGNVVWMSQRDCTTQRRHQKLVEEAPAFGVEPEVAEAMGEAATKVCKSCGYLGAGTIEFLYSDGKFYFLEMNTRIQVEHPVTEQVLGLDLIALQLQVADGQALGLDQQQLVPRGHAIECRINAEDPTGGLFRPSPGRITRMELPGGPGVRIDTGYVAGDQVSGHFDNLVAKLICWAPTREAARQRMLRALAETTIEGIATNIPAHSLILNHPDFAAGRHYTSWLEQDVDLSQIAGPQVTSSTSDEPAPAHEVTAEIEGKRYRVRIFGIPASARQTQTERGRQSRSRDVQDPDGEVIRVPMQGTVVAVRVAVGDLIDPGSTICVLEAMKMENSIVSERGGRVKELRVAPGDAVAAGDIVAIVEPGQNN